MAIQDQVGRLFVKRSNGAWSIKPGNTLGTTAEVVETSAAAITVTAAQSGTTFVASLGSGTQTFTLPAAAAGLTYTFVCNHASGEILINPGTGDAIRTQSFLVVGASPTTAAVAPTTPTGIKNTAASNVIGDTITLRAIDATTWQGVGLPIGIWQSQ